MWPYDFWVNFWLAMWRPRPTAVILQFKRKPDAKA